MLRLTNITDSDGIYVLGRRSRSLASNASITIENPTPEELKDAQAYQLKRTLSITQEDDALGQQPLSTGPDYNRLKFAGAISNGNNVTIDGHVFAWAASEGAAPAGSYYVGAGAAAGASATALAEAINDTTSTTGLRATEITLDSIPYVLVAKLNPENPLTVLYDDEFAVANTGANLVWDDTDSFATETGRVSRQILIAQSVSAADVTAKGVTWPVQFTSGAIVSFLILRDDTPVTDWDGKLTFADGVIILDDSAALAPLEEDDAVSIVIAERVPSSYSGG